MTSTLISRLKERGNLVSPELIRAFEEIPRTAFVPSDLVHLAEHDNALPIGYGQTISQPTTVALMLELLEPKLGDRVLDVGSGSGWMTALLASVVGEQGKVIAMERVPELCELTRHNVEKFGLVRSGIVECICRNAALGYPEGAPFERIVVSASALRIPDNLKRQLAIGGRLVIPIGNCLTVVERKGEREFVESEFPGFVFVPFIEQES